MDAPRAGANFCHPGNFGRAHAFGQHVSSVICRARSPTSLHFARQPGRHASPNSATGCAVGVGAGLRPIAPPSRPPVLPAGLAAVENGAPSGRQAHGPVPVVEADEPIDDTILPDGSSRAAVPCLHHVGTSAGAIRHPTQELQREQARRLRHRALVQVRSRILAQAVAIPGGLRSPDGAQRNPGQRRPHFAALHAGYGKPARRQYVASPKPKAEPCSNSMTIGGIFGPWHMGRLC